MSAQVGINTDFPTVELHIDGKGDNTSTPSQAMILNDVGFTSEGKLGIGNLTPSAKTDIYTEEPGYGFRLADGTQKNGALLTYINNSGDAAWREKTHIKIVAADGQFSGPVNSELQYVCRKVTLEPGKWLLRTLFLMHTKTDASIDSGFYAKFAWAEKNSSGTYFLTSDATFGNSIGGAYIWRYGLARGMTIIENTSSAPKTYYLVNQYPEFWGGFDSTINWDYLGNEVWKETSIVAFPAD